ncbi:hypothetical protein VNO78_20386 [Psophocarpus tetragonolobus]|uniref:Uncharacterized protein n=1 Tax=Psophocarpus tetragonolobus TaxID=3891 RepID=A0AAN9S9U4_PSOTE
MAKKKSSQPHDPKHSEDMADHSSVQIQNLKNLNAVLLKETAQHRHQFHSLQSALDHSADINAAFDIQNAVISAYLTNHVWDINLGVRSLLQDKDSEVAAFHRQLSHLTARLQDETAVLAQEAKLFQDSLHTQTLLRQEADELRFQAEELLSQEQRHVSELITDRDLAVKASHELIQTLTEEKNQAEHRNNVQDQQIAALETELHQLNVSFRKQEQVTTAKVLQLEGNLAVSLQKEDYLTLEISGLVKEKKEMERSLDILTEEKDSVCKSLNVLRKALEDKQHELDELVRERGVSLAILENGLSELKLSCGMFEEENKQLHSQVKRYKNAFDVVVLEKESVKKKVEELELLVIDTRKVAEKSDAELGKVRSEREKLVKKENLLEERVSVLKKENDALQSMVEEARRESEDLSARVQVWCSNSHKALTLLKTTAAALVCQQRERDEEVVSNENHVEEEIQPYAQELEAIKKAFKSKDEMVDDMKQQLVTLNKSVAEAHKSKSLLTVISSATTIFAAVLAAYFARGG